MKIKKSDLIKLIKEFKANSDFTTGSGNKALTDLFDQEDFKEKRQIRLWCWKLHSPKENKTFYEYVGEKSVMEACVSGDGTIEGHFSPMMKYERSGGITFRGPYGPKEKRKTDDVLSSNYNVIVSDQGRIKQMLCSDDVGSIIVHDHSSDFASGEINIKGKKLEGELPFLELFYTPVPDIITIVC